MDEGGFRRMGYGAGVGGGVGREYLVNKIVRKLEDLGKTREGRELYMI